MHQRLVCLLCLSFAAAAQAPPAFEVASVKPTDPNSGPWHVDAKLEPDGIRFTNMILRLAILRAYGIQPYQLTAPEWIGTARFSIAAKSAAPVPRSRSSACCRRCS